ncbi:MAG: SAM-dependent methyltransferase [Clostridia bacterium]|nr:SAM-dependent methyltransferase [Clostridia bacterium]
MIRLTDRLAAVASLIKGGGSVADIGTDHAYLTVWLVQNGFEGRVIASDIGEGPLANARKTVDIYGLGGRIELRVSDGLKAYAPGEADEIVIAGMGGELIADILSAVPWVKRPGTRLVLQPMSHQQDVRRWLSENGFRTEKELCVPEGRRAYLVISADYTGECESKEEGYYYFGELPPQTPTEARMKHATLRHLKTRVRSLHDAGRLLDEETLLNGAIAYYERNCKE